MKAAVVNALGRVPVYADFPDPEPGDRAKLGSCSSQAF
jgi:hypothetical protein